MDQKLANAHLIADHLKAIARLLQSDPEPLTPEASAAIGDGILIALGPNAGLDLNLLAETLEATAPFVPLTDSEKSSVVEELVDEVGDYSSFERAELVFADWTPAHWRMEFDDREEQRLEDEREEAGE